jgi:hypothetical protein
MTAGVPGTGIGGLFYLVAALLLPLRGVMLRMRGARVSWPTLFRQMRLAVGVFLGIWATGWLVGFIVGPVAGTATVAERADSVTSEYQSVLRWAALLAGFATLAVVLLSVQVARLVVRKRD